MITSLIAVAATVAALGGNAQAAEHDHWRHDVRSFHIHNIALWRQGRWYHGWHGGRLAWWWIAAGSWYVYTRPIYPYPDPYVPSTIVVQTQVPPPSSPPTVVVEPPVAAAPPVAPPVAEAPVPPPPPVNAPPAPTTVAQAQAYWYHCSQPDGYYPYVPSCAGGWTQVPATPPR